MYIQEPFHIGVIRCNSTVLLQKNWRWIEINGHSFKDIPRSKHGILFLFIYYLKDVYSLLPSRHFGNVQPQYLKTSHIRSADFFDFFKNMGTSQWSVYWKYWKKMFNQYYMYSSVCSKYSLTHQCYLFYKG